MSLPVTQWSRMSCSECACAFLGAGYKHLTYCEDSWGAVPGNTGGLVTSRCWAVAEGFPFMIRDERDFSCGLELLVDG